MGLLDYGLGGGPVTFGLGPIQFNGFIIAPLLVQGAQYRQRSGFILTPPNVFATAVLQRTPINLFLNFRGVFTNADLYSFNTLHRGGFYADVQTSTVSTGETGFLTAACDNGIISIVLKDTTFVETYNFPIDGSILFTMNSPTFGGVFPPASGSNTFQALLNNAILQAPTIDQTKLFYADLDTDTHSATADTFLHGTLVTTTTIASPALFIMNGFTVNTTQSYGTLASIGPFTGPPYNLTNTPVTPRSFQLIQTSGSSIVATDNGFGTIYGNSVPTGAITGTINYNTGVVSFSFATSPGLAYSTSYAYSKYSEFNNFTLNNLGAFTYSAGSYIYDVSDLVYQISTTTTMYTL